MKHLARFDFIALVLLLLPLYSCLDTGVDSKEVEGDYQIAILNPAEKPDELAIDNYRIVAISPLNTDTWQVIVDYSGGCKDHLFLIWWSGEVSTDGLAELYLIHDGQEDQCDALVRDTIDIQLDMIFSESATGAPIPSTVINLSEQQEIEINPDISDLEALGCSISVELVPILCGTGVWEDVWMIPVDTTSIFSKVIFQPVRSEVNRSYSLTAAQAEVDILYGYEFQKMDNAITCVVTSEREVVPVSVKCLEQF
ncbi:hypothetical protein [Marinoscillum sp. MHG1-6]|uniref:hypothetical protein n=1 Tax=Marinoscillum sp. MHG1-6 TaxID=2959627 RepID=UPI0021573AB5|nr:hypothetical protein [Marinoscillum sp. MHG1-6]